MRRLDLSYQHEKEHGDYSSVVYAAALLYFTFPELSRRGSVSGSASVGQIIRSHAPLLPAGNTSANASISALAMRILNTPSSVSRVIPSPTVACKRLTAVPPLSSRTSNFAP